MAAAGLSAYAMLPVIIIFFGDYPVNKTLMTVLSFSVLIVASGCTPAEISGLIRDVASSQPSASPSARASSAAPVTNSGPSNGASSQPTNSPNSQNSAAPVASADLAAFQTRYLQQAKTPRGAAQMLLDALVNGVQHPEQAEAYLTVVLRSDQLESSAQSPTGYSLGASGKFMLQQMQTRPEIIYSYVGGTPDKDYQNWSQSSRQLSFPAHGAMVGQIVVDNSAEQPGASTGRLYVSSSGRDTPVPINMDRNRDGIWKIQTSSLGNLAAGVKPGTANAGNF